jgi:metallo-beta-lactamase class B IMP
MESMSKIFVFFIVLFCSITAAGESLPDLKIEKLEEGVYVPSPRIAGRCPR